METQRDHDLSPVAPVPPLLLSGTIPEERPRGRRVGILETDSDYVKLAKQGGHRGLLRHEEPNEKMKSTSPYRAPDWFCNVDSSAQESLSPTKHAAPDFMTHKEFQKTEKSPFQSTDAPFGTDNKSAWQRESDRLAAGENLTNAANEMKELSLTPKGFQEANKFKKISFEKRAPPVNMSKLLSFGYAEVQTPPVLSVTSELTGPALPAEQRE
ncbi:uncharacterized protein C7orf57-like [Denticeps clupeoides]|uniref:Uncharacterized protein n=1 Tax=Denticeps clupeoides TaxID=299321 RepID=A0AAY4CWX2_9TELE|nr:uncharacterized protein C7orf57-like [Denticeps clupeoides]